MNKSAKRLASKGKAEFLKFNPSDPARIQLYRPGADWTKASEYPQIKSHLEYSRADYLRLAWEILRRMPRYRHQYQKLMDFGIKHKATFFLGIPNAFFTDERMPHFSYWEDVPLRGHKCVPPISFPNQTLGEYVAERKEKDEPWFVMHRYKWILDLWGIKYAPDPDTAFIDLVKPDLFEAPGAIVEIKDRNYSQAKMVSTFVRPNEVLCKIRLDTSLEHQFEAIRLELKQSRKVALDQVNDIMEPLGLPKPKMKRMAMSIDLNNLSLSETKINELGGRALLKQLEMSPIWLRTWDAVQQARKDNLANYTAGADSKHQWPRLSRVDLVSRFERDYLENGTLVQNTGMKESKSQSSRGVSNTPPLQDLLFDWLEPSMVPNWRARSENYIEEGDDAFRQLVSTAFVKK